jgi:hypothetical protein
MARAFSLAVNSIETCCSVFDVDRGISGIPFAGDTGHETKEAQEGSFKVAVDLPRYQASETIARALSHFFR